MDNLPEDESRLRDHTILQLCSAESRRLNDEPIEIVDLLARSPPPRHGPPAIASDVELPLVFLEGDREALGIAGYYLDPPDLGPSLPLAVVLPKWAGFARLMSSSKSVEGTSQRDYAYNLLHRAVADSRRIRGVSPTRRFVERLHRHRWTIGAEMTASLLVAGTVENEAEYRKRADDIAFIETATDTLRNRLTVAKEQSRTLTEWCEALYLLNPLVWEVMGYVKRSALKDADKWYRFFAEVDADIAPVNFLSVSTIIRRLLNKDMPSWTRTHFLAEREKATSLKEFRQKMHWLLHARTTIPKFWFDLALKSFDVPESSLPAELDELDPWRTVSIDVLQAWSMRWQEDR